ncbi:MAG: DMT family transporter [Candidatus Tectomicrobia bacterium]|nr:DMT family transporter [Candidatus Tectomicrobia bacterium]
MKYLWLLAAGMFHPGLFLVFFLIGIEKIGVSRAAPIKGSTPLFGALLAMFFLQERPTWVHLAGLVMVVGGIGLLTSRNPHGGWKRADAAWPAAAALAFGAGSLLWRKGLDGLPDPLAATFVGVLASLIVVGGYVMLTTRGAASAPGESKRVYFLISGLTTGCGMYLYVRALQHGEIYRVLPLVQLSPLFTVALSMIFLRRVERVTWEVVAGAVITVTGAVLVALKPWAFS